MSSQTIAGPAAFDVVTGRLRRARAVATAVRPAYVLGALLLGQWIGVLALALTARHNGWLYYAGGDQLWHYSGAYLLGHGHLPPAYVGYGWSMMLLPISWFAGPNLVSALPAIVLLNTLILLPVALLCVYGIASRLAGRLFGYFAALAWILLPYLGILVVEPGYHQKYTELTLPQQLGLSSVPDFPATVALLVSAYLCLRAAESRGWQAAAAAGLAAGWSIAIKPSNSIFLVAPALFFLVERRRWLLVFAAGLAPALLTLALWKYRGLGELAAAPAERVRLAAGVDSLLHRIHSPSLNSWGHLQQVLDAFREHFWASRVIEWLPVAGCIALLVRARRAFLLVGTWFIVFLLAKGTYIPASVEDASFFRILMPAFPAYLLLSAAVVLLIPGVRPRPAERRIGLDRRKLTVALTGAVAVFAVLPLGVIAAVPRLHDGAGSAVRVGDSLVPVSSSVGLEARAQDGAVRLDWRPRPSAGGSIFYRVLRKQGAGDGAACPGRLRNASDSCQLFMDEVGSSRVTTFNDRPGRGTWTYRIGVAANWLNDPTLGDVYVVGKPVIVTVP
jgi:Dolichyl-phosphate-mannose-protein mannosyltransferase